MKVDIRFAKDVAISLLSAYTLRTYCAMIYRKNFVPRGGFITFEIVKGEKRICKVTGRVERIEPYSEGLAKIYVPISGFRSLEEWKERVRLMTHSFPSPETHEIVIIRAEDVSCQSSLENALKELK